MIRIGKNTEVQNNTDNDDDDDVDDNNDNQNITKASLRHEVRYGLNEPNGRCFEVHII